MKLSVHDLAPFRLPSGTLSHLLLLSAALACSANAPERGAIQVSRNAAMDASTESDAGPMQDAEIDAAMRSEIGIACSPEAGCRGECIGSWPQGYCSVNCTATHVCPSDALCVPLSRSVAMCLQVCDPQGPRTCRPGYGCASDPRRGNVCLPGCEDDSDCATGHRCDPLAGTAGEGSCYDPTASIGGACDSDASCPQGGLCQPEDSTGWPAGACLSVGCELSGNDCGAGAVCVRGQDANFCVEDCSASGECRTGYRCETSGEVRGCFPGCTDASVCSDGRVCYAGEGRCTSPFQPTNLGRTCSQNAAACTGGTCWREYDSGFPGSICTYLGCQLGVADADDGCPGAGTCANVDGAPACLPSCISSTACRSGYICADVDPAHPESGRSCVPGCTADTQCANEDFVCNRGTGRCTQPFNPSLSGRACEYQDDCPGGQCLSERNAGFPGGMCVLPGCRTDGGLQSVACPTGTVCAADGGDPMLGSCFPRCDAGNPASCREGYVCVSEGAANPYCAPALTR